MRYITLSFALLVLTTLSLGASAAEKRWEKYDLKSIGAERMRAARKQEPKVKFGEAFVRQDGKYTIHMIRGKDDQGRQVDVTFGDSPSILNNVTLIETEIKFTDVPKVVADALKAKKDDALVGFKPTRIIKEVAPPSEPTINDLAYWFYGTNGEGDKLAVRSTRDGKIIAVKHAED